MECLTAIAILEDELTATAVLETATIGTCPDATAVLKNTLGTTLSTTAIPSGDTEDITAPDGTFHAFDSAGNAIGTFTIASGQIKSNTSPDTPVTVKNSANTTIATGNVLTITGGNVSVADVDNVDSDGSTVPTPAGVAFTCTPQVKDLFSKFTFESGHDTSSLVTIDADSAGTYTSSSQDGASGTITYSKNGGAYAAFSNPTTYANGDTLAVKRTVTTALGWVKITGTYV